MVSRESAPQGDEHDPIADDRLTATWIELAIRLAVLGLLLYRSFILVRPFLTIVIWSVVLFNAIEAQVPAGKIVRVVLDNYAAHKQPKVTSGKRWASTALAGSQISQNTVVS